MREKDFKLINFWTPTGWELGHSNASETLPKETGRNQIGIT